MKKIFSSLTLACVLATTLSAFAQDQMKQDDMKKDDAQHDTMKNDNMKSDKKMSKKAKKAAKKDAMKNDDMKKDDMKKDDMKKYSRFLPTVGMTKARMEPRTPSGGNGLEADSSLRSE